METIEIDSELYRYLLSNALRIGEEASSILRRLLNLPLSPVQNGQFSAVPTLEDSKDTRSERPGLSEFVRTLQFQNHRNATDRFLALLSLMHQERADDFERILQVSGRRRTYFGQSESEITRSGRSTHPRQIPGSPYWVLTNADTNHKQDIFRRAASTLGYSSNEIELAARAI